MKKKSQEIPQIFLGVLKGAFSGFGCPKRHPDALLAKTLFPPPTLQWCKVNRWVKPFLPDASLKKCLNSRYF